MLVPMVLNAHGGTKYGLPFPVLARAAFGVRGANVPSLLRALVACGWFGIQTWVGAGAIHTLLNGLLRGALTAPPVAWLGISLPEAVCFLAFWAAQVAIIVRGVECIKVVERYSAPVLIFLTAALLAWAVSAAGGVGPMLSAPSAFAPGAPRAGQLWGALLPAVTANVGFWATMSLNMPDFSRYASSQASQLAGQALGLPLTMILFSAVALVVTSATVVLFGAPIADPVLLLQCVGGVGATSAGLVGLIVATLSTNIAANVVAPANAFVNVMPHRLSFRAGGVTTAVLGMLVCPWRLVSSTDGYIFVWLVGYSALLGPVAGATPRAGLHCSCPAPSHACANGTQASCWQTIGCYVGACSTSTASSLQRRRAPTSTAKASTSPRSPPPRSASRPTCRASCTWQAWRPCTPPG